MREKMKKEYLQIFIEPELKREISDKANNKGLSLSSYVRSILIEVMKEKRNDDLQNK